MGIYEELKARGLIAQVTDEEQIRELVNNGKATFYIGFDCTADSLHVGHFMALCLMKRLQMAGNKPIALIGGGTTMIGDPSGRNDMRKMLTKEDIDHNAECFKRQMERFIEFGEGKAMMLNNADWLMNLNYIELLREELPEGLSLPDQMAYTCLRNIYFLYYNKTISRDQAAAEKQRVRVQWERAASAAEFERKLSVHHARVIRETEAAKTACRKDPTAENALRLCNVMDGLTHE